MTSKNIHKMMNELTVLVEQVKMICSKIVQKQPINGTKLPENTGVAKKAS